MRERVGKFLVIWVMLLGGGCRGEEVPSCETNDECPFGHVCESGACRRVCESAEDCPPGMECNGLLCVEIEGEVVPSVGGCTIDDLTYLAGEPNPVNPCEVCDTRRADSAWSPVEEEVDCADDGVACTEDVCVLGACQHLPTDICGECTIGDATFDAGQINPSNACEVCDPDTSRHGWTVKLDGLACPDDGNACTSDVCDTGSCAHSPILLGGACGGGRFCDGGGACLDGCLIEDTIYDAGVTNPSSDCERCDVSVSRTAWSPEARLTVCGENLVCDGQGECAGFCEETCGSHCGVGSAPSRAAVQAFYYPGYGRPEVDGGWHGWEAPDPSGTPHDPASGSLPATFYPALGAYSSSDTTVIEQHMQWLDQAGIGVVVVAWSGRDSHADRQLLPLLDAADNLGLLVAVSIEPFDGGYGPAGSRTPFEVRDDIRYLIDRYGCHRGLLREAGRPVFYVVDSGTYHSGVPTDWRLVWDELHAESAYDPVVLAQDTDLDGAILPGGWDGGFERGCAEMAFMVVRDTVASAFAAESKRLVISVCPGYDDSPVDDDEADELDRSAGATYDEQWAAALSMTVSPHAVIVTSFNEWRDGTQIEPSANQAGYASYDGAFGLSASAAQNAYVERTRVWSDRVIYGGGHCGERPVSTGYGSGGSCTNSAWDGEADGLLECHAQWLEDRFVLQGTYRQATTEAAVMKLDLPYDLSHAVCGGLNALVFRIRVSSLSNFDVGHLEIGNCMDCSQELQLNIDADMLADDTWVELRFQLDEHPNFANVDWTAVDHVRFYWFGNYVGFNQNLESFHVYLDDLRIGY